MDGQNRRGIEHHEIEKITQIVQQAGKSGAVGQGHGAIVVRSLRQDIQSRRFIQEYGIVQRALALKQLGKADRLERIELHAGGAAAQIAIRSEEHTSELQSLMRISYAVFCLKKKKTNT